MKQKENKKWKKKAAVGMVAAAASASVLVGGAFDSPADLLNPDNDNDSNSPTPVVETVPLHTAAAAMDDGGSDDGSGDSEERRQKLPAVRRWIQSMPVAVRALIGVPLWCAGWAITNGLGLLWQAAMTPLGSRILSWILAAVSAVLVFALTAKAIFPNVPWKKLLRPRNVLIVLGGMAALGAADTLLSVFWKDYPPIGRLLRLAGGALMITAACLSTRKLARRFTHREEPEKVPEPEPVLSVEEQAMALADTVCPRPIRQP